MKKSSSPLKSLTVGLVTLLVLIVLAYGFSVTKIDFAETRSERRVASLTRILRALAHPKLFDYEYQEVDVQVPFYLGCPEGGVTSPEKTGVDGEHQRGEETRITLFRPKEIEHP